MNISVADSTPQKTRSYDAEKVQLSDIHGHTSEVRFVTQPILVAGQDELCINVPKSNSRMRMHLYNAVATFLATREKDELKRLTGSDSVTLDDIGTKQRAVFEVVHCAPHQPLRVRFYVINQETGGIDSTPQEVGGLDELGCLVYPHKK